MDIENPKTGERFKAVRASLCNPSGDHEALVITFERVPSRLEELESQIVNAKDKYERVRASITSSRNEFWAIGREILALKQAKKDLEIRDGSFDPKDIF